MNLVLSFFGLTGKNLNQNKWIFSMKFLKKTVFGLLLITFLGLLSISVLFVFREPVIATYNFVRPMLLTGGGDDCINELRQKKVQFTELGSVGTKQCPRLNAVRVSGFEKTKISSPFVLSCPAANAVASWVNDFGASSFTHTGTLNCRRQRNNNLFSEHSFGLAIDISHIDGASVKSDWGKDDSNGKKLNAATKSACKFFNNVLTPDTNSLHASHYHLDKGIGFGCKFSKVSGLIFRQLRALKNYVT